MTIYLKISAIIRKIFPVPERANIKIENADSIGDRLCGTANGTGGPGRNVCTEDAKNGREILEAI